MNFLEHAYNIELNILKISLFIVPVLTKVSEPSMCELNTQVLLNGKLLKSDILITKNKSLNLTFNMNLNKFI